MRMARIAGGSRPAPTARDRARRTTAQPPRVSARRPRKTPTNLSLREDLVRRAKALGLNLSQVVEQSLAKAIREAEQARWLAENAQAIDHYNAFVEEHGAFSDEHRLF